MQIYNLSQAEYLLIDKYYICSRFYKTLNK